MFSKAEQHGTYYAINVKPAERPIAQSFGVSPGGCGQVFSSATGLDPVNLATGNFAWEETDLFIPASVLPLAWTRTYNSRDTRRGMLGQGWSLSYETHLVFDGEEITLVAANGAQSTYIISDTAIFRPQAQLATLTREGDGYRLLRPDYRALYFNSSGTLTSIQDRDGRAFSLGYDGNNLSSITDSAGREYTIVTDAQGRITQVTDSYLNRSVEYTYNEQARLDSVTDVREGTTTYAYNSDGYLETITLPTGEVRVTNAYDGQGRVISQQVWNDSPSTINYLDTPMELTRQVELEEGQAVDVPYEISRTTVTDGKGRITFYDHDASGRLVHIVEQAHREAQEDHIETWIMLSTDDQPVGVQDPLGRDAGHGYDANGNLLTVRDPLGNTVDFAYTADNLLAASRDQQGNVTSYAYTDEKLLHTITAPSGHTTGIEYEPRPVSGMTVQLPTSVTDARGNTTTYGYDEKGQLTSITTPLGAVTGFAYDEGGRLTTITDPLGVVEYRKYDAANNLLRIVHNYKPGESATVDQNVSTTLSYDSIGRVEAITDPLGNATHYSYANGRLEEIISYNDSDPIITTIDYNAIGLPVTRTLNYEDGAWDPLFPDKDIRTVTQYDDMNRPKEIIEHYQDGVIASPTELTDRVTSYDYDKVGNLLAVTDPLGRVTVMDYDALNRLKTEIRACTDANGEPASRVEECAEAHGSANDRNLREEWEYTVRGEVEARTDALGHTTRYEYNALGYMIAVTLNAEGEDAPTDLATTYAYDALGNLTGITDARGNSITTRAYDELNRLQTVTDALGRETAYAYDAAGRLTTAVDGRNLPISYTYDALHRLESISAPADATAGIPAVNITMGYDAAGRRAQMADASGTTSYGYDPLNRLTSVAHTATGTVSYGYDDVGRRVQMTIDGGPVLTYGYNAGGWLETVSRNAVPVASYSYDRAGRPTQVWRANGFTTAYDYDATDRLHALTTTRTDGTTLSSFEHQFDAAGQAVVVTETMRMAAVQQAVAAAPLLRATTPTTHLAATHSIYLPLVARSPDEDVQVIHYEYDGVQRLIEARVEDGTTSSYGYDEVGNRTRSGETTTAYDAANQVIGWQYDVAGNLLSDGTTSYTYDALNRLRGVASSGGTTSYTYNGDGVLLAQVQNGVETRFVADVARALPEQVGAVTGTAATWYVRGLGGEEIYRDANGSVAWFLSDRLGSIRAEYERQAGERLAMSIRPTARRWAALRRTTASRGSRATRQQGWSICAPGGMIQAGGCLRAATRSGASRRCPTACTPTSMPTATRCGGRIRVGRLLQFVVSVTCQSTERKENF